MLSDKELIDAYVLGGAGVPGIRAVAAEVARKTLEDAAFDALLSSGRTFASREGFHDWLRARAASISTDKAGEGG